MKEVTKVLAWTGIWIVLTVALLVGFLWCLDVWASPETDVQPVESWNVWGAEPPPTPWKDGCKDDWCPSIIEGLEKGESWCLSKGGCGDYHRTESYAIYMKYKAWFNEFCGGTPGIWAAQTVRTESEGDPDAHIKKTSECGLASVDMEHAIALDVNPCDPKANIWATCYARNNQLIQLRADVKGLDKAPIQDQWMLAGASGAAGNGKIIRLLKWSKALSGKHPYNAIRNHLRGLHSKWKKATDAKMAISKLGLDEGLGKIGMSHEAWKDLEQYAEVYDKNGPWDALWKAGLGLYRPGRTAFRIARPEGARKVIEPLFPDGQMPWGDPVLPERPADIWGYPGKKDHCACHLWPEMKNQVPTEEENEKWTLQNEPGDPAKLKCVKGFKGKLVCKIQTEQ